MGQGGEGRAALSWFQMAKVKYHQQHSKFGHPSYRSWIIRLFASYNYTQAYYVFFIQIHEHLSSVYTKSQFSKEISYFSRCKSVALTPDNFSNSSIDPTQTTLRSKVYQIMSTAQSYKPERRTRFASITEAERTSILRNTSLKFRQLSSYIQEPQSFKQP